MGELTSGDTVDARSIVRGPIAVAVPAENQVLVVTEAAAISASNTHATITATKAL